jgi:hypothetical protein
MTNDMTLDYDEHAAAVMLAALRTCPRWQQIDTLAAVIKVFVETDYFATELMPGTPHGVAYTGPTGSAHGAPDWRDE